VSEPAVFSGYPLPAVLACNLCLPVHRGLRGHARTVGWGWEAAGCLARLNTAPLHSIPKLPLPATTVPVQVDIAAIHNAIAATRHLLQLFRPQLDDDKSRANSNASRSGISTSVTNSTSLPTKNERTLAGQRAQS
jgi:hypothetical protein